MFRGFKWVLRMLPNVPTMDSRFKKNDKSAKLYIYYNIEYIIIILRISVIMKRQSISLN